MPVAPYSIQPSSGLNCCETFTTGVISRGAQGGGNPLVESVDHFGEGSAPLKILALALLFKVY